jgi:hypothetical protein
VTPRPSYFVVGLSQKVKLETALKGQKGVRANGHYRPLVLI